MKTGHMNKRALALWWVALSMGTMVGAAAYAQQATQGALEEIVVTAQKRVEDVQQVPIAITSISADILQRKGITNVSQLSSLAPNVNLDAGTPFSGSDTVLSAYIRGIGQDDFAFNVDPGVGVYVDGVYLARSVGANTTMLDVDRVEILKGPQGTLFGRNSIGGAISIVTRDPGHEFKAKGEVTSGQFNRFDTKLTFDLPLAERVLTTVSFSSEKRDGYQRRIPYVQTNVNGSAGIPDCTTATCSFLVDPGTAFPASGYQTADHEGGINKWSARAKVVFLVSDEIKLTVAGDYLHVDQSAAANTVTYPGGNNISGIANACLLGVPGLNFLCTLPRGGLSPTPTPMQALPPLFGVNVDGNPLNNYLPLDNRFQTGNIDTSYATGNSFSQLKNWGLVSTLDWALGHGMNLKWINGYRDLHWDTGMDLDGSPEVALHTSFDMPQHQVSEELQLNGVAVDNRLNYAVGAYYFREAGHLHDYVPFPYGLLIVDGPNDLQTEAEALYAHFNFKLTDQWAFTAGGRYTKEHKQFQGHQTDDNGLTYKISGCFPPGDPANLHLDPTIPPFVTCQNALGFPVPGSPYTYYPVGPFTQNYSNFSPTFGVEFHFSPDAMLYASYSKGYKTGSWTTRLSNPHPTYDASLHFDPEFAQSTELGFKSELLEHRLRLNLAAFHTKYSNIQLNSQQGISPTLLNAGDARINGFELEAEALLGGGLSVNFAAGTTDAKYTHVNPGVGDNGVVIDTSFPLPKTPKWKAYIGPQYVIGLANGGAVLFDGDYTHTAKESNDLGNTDMLRRDATDIVNASVTYRAPDGAWEFAVGGTDLTDKRYIVGGQYNGGAGINDASWNRPREWFATVRFSPQASGK